MEFNGQYTVTYNETPSNLSDNYWDVSDYYKPHADGIDAEKRGSNTTRNEKNGTFLNSDGKSLIKITLTPKSSVDGGGVDIKKRKNLKSKKMRKANNLLKLLVSILICSCQIKTSQECNLDIKKLFRYTETPLFEKDLDGIKLIYDKYEIKRKLDLRVDGSYSGVVYFYDRVIYTQDSIDVVNFCTSE